MKKITAILLAVVFLLPALLSCGTGLTEETKTAEPAGTATAAETKEAETKEAGPGRSVQSPLAERPNYVLHEGATADEMRQMAIKAVRDGLSFCWYPEKEVEYSYTSPNNGTTVSFHLYPQRTYAGVPYSSSYTGLFQMLEYYDFETGMISVPTPDLFTTLVGNDCAGRLLWGIAACVPTFEPTSDGYGRKSPNMVAVGNYDLPAYSAEPSTIKITQDNGQQTMFEAYTHLKPADTVFTGGNAGIAGHYMMLLEEPNVVRNADGTIDGKNSTITVQEQMRGHHSTSSEYVKKEDGETRNYSGRWDSVKTFDYLFGEGYIPVTCKEFIGEGEYIMPSVSLDREVTSLEELVEASLKSQYMICAFHTRLVDADGNVVFSRNKATSYSDMTSGKLKNYPLKSLSISRTGLSRATGLKGTYTLEIDCIDATGSQFEVIRLSVTF